MRPLRSADIVGTWGAVLLPLNADDSIDFGALGDHVDALLAANLSGIYTNGSAGEFHTQSEAEYDRVNALVAERCNRRGISFQIGACHMSAQLSRERMLRAKCLAPSAFQVIVPDWMPISFSEAALFLERMAELADPIGLVLYNPGHAKRRFDLPSIAELRTAVPNLVGVKMMDGDAAWYESMRRALPNFSVFVPGHHLATGWKLGASGSYSNVACLQPSGARAWQQLMINNPPAALEFEGRLLEFFKTHVAPLIAGGLSPIAIDKALCAAGGWCAMSPRLRWPYRSADNDVVGNLSEMARQALPELWDHSCWQ